MHDAPSSAKGDATTASLGEGFISLTKAVDSLLALHSRRAQGPHISSAPSGGCSPQIVRALERYLYPTIRAVQAADRSLVLQDGANEAGLVASQWLLKQVVQWASHAASPLALSEHMMRVWFRFHSIGGSVSVFVVLLTSVPHSVRIMLRYGRLSDPFAASLIRQSVFGVFQLAIASLHVVSKDSSAQSTPLITIGALAVLQCALSCLRGLGQLFRAFVVAGCPIGQEILDYEFKVTARLTLLVQRRCDRNSQPSLGKSLSDGGTSLRCLLRRMSVKAHAGSSSNLRGEAATADRCVDGAAPADDAVAFTESSSSERLTNVSGAATEADPPRLLLEKRLMEYCRLMHPILFERTPNNSSNFSHCPMCWHDDALVSALCRDFNEQPVELFPHHNDAKSAFLIRCRVFDLLSSTTPSRLPHQRPRRSSLAPSVGNSYLFELAFLRHSKLGTLITTVLPEHFLDALAPLVARLVVESNNESRKHYVLLEELIRRVWPTTSRYSYPQGGEGPRERHIKCKHLNETTTILVERLANLLIAPPLPTLDIRSQDAPPPPTVRSLAAEAVLEATELCPIVRAAVLAGCEEPALGDVHLRLLVVVLTFLDRPQHSWSPNVVLLASSLITLLLAAERQLPAVKKLCAISSTRQLLLRAFSRFRCAASPLSADKRICEKLLDFASRVRNVYPPVGASLENAVVHGAAASVASSENVPRTHSSSPSTSAGRTRMLCPVNAATLPDRPTAPGHNRIERNPASPDDEPPQWSWSSLSLPVLMGNLVLMWMCSLSAHSLPDSLRPLSAINFYESPRSSENSRSVRITRSRNIVSRLHSEGLDSVREFFRSIVCTLRSVAAIYKRSASKQGPHETAGPLACLDAFIMQMIVPAFHNRRGSSSLDSPLAGISSATTSPLALLNIIIVWFNSAVTRGGVSLSGTVQQRLLEVHFMIKDALERPWKEDGAPQTIPGMKQRAPTPSPVATTRDLGRHLAAVISGTHNYSTITRFSADQLERYNPFGATLLRMAASPALLLLQKGADMGHVAPETALIRDFVPSLLQSRIQIRDIMDQYPNQKMAASLLKELGTAAIRAIHTWTMDGIPLADASTGVRSHTRSRFPFCAAGLRSKIMVDLLTCDMFRPLHANDPLHVLGQVHLQVVNWLCRENRRHLVDLAGTVTPQNMQNLLAPLGNSGNKAGGPSLIRESCSLQYPFNLSKMVQDCKAAPCSLDPFIIPSWNHDDDRVLTVADFFQRRLAHSLTLQRNHQLLVDNSNPLQIMATVQLVLEETRWRCVTNTEVLPLNVASSLDDACRFTASVVEPWCIRVCPPEPMTAWGVRCPYMLNPSSRSGEGCFSIRGVVDSSDIPSLSGPTRSSSASASVTLEDLNVASGSRMKGQCFLLIPWWDAAGNLTQSRWLAQESTMVLLFGSRQSVRELTILHRARVALLALISAHGSEVFPLRSKQLALLHSVPSVEWLPVLEQLLSIAAALFARGDANGAQFVIKLLEGTCCEFPEQAVWPLLFHQHRQENVERRCPQSAGIHSDKEKPPGDNVLLLNHQTRVASEVLDTVAARSHEQRLLVETMTLAHRVLRRIAVLPVEQLVSDVKFFTAVISQAEASSAALIGGSSRTAAPTAAIEALRTIQHHFTEFDHHEPVTEFERFMRIELLPFVRQIVQMMDQHHLGLSTRAAAMLSNDHSHFNLVALLRDCGPLVSSLRDRLDAIMSTLTRTVALSSIVPELQLTQLTALLKQRGIVLLDVRDLVHMSPGLWPIHRQAIASRDIDALLTVFPSAQRPKRVTFGSGASSSTSSRTKSHFLVKGHEDLRQDQRIQRLLRVFSLTAPPHTTLRLSTYSVIPLSTTSGLVEWVPQSETVGRLVMQYRGLAGIPMQREAHMIIDLAKASETDSDVQSDCSDFPAMLSRYDALEFKDRLRVYRALVPPKLSSPSLASRRLPELGGVHRSLHCELHHMLLGGSLTAASFLSRRKAFMESVAAMSVLGDVIGLGDRHPSNILVDKTAFHVTHIDFGDAFGVAQRRSRFPEHVPFRATRMLERCLGVDGFSAGGTFQLACASVGCMFADSSHHTSWLRGTLVLELLLPFLDDDGAPVSRQSSLPGSAAMDGVASNMSAYTTTTSDQATFYGVVSKRMCTAHIRYSATVMPATGIAPHNTPTAGKERQAQVDAANTLQLWWRQRNKQRRGAMAIAAMPGGSTYDHAGGHEDVSDFVDGVEVRRHPCLLPRGPPRSSCGGGKPQLGSHSTVAANVQLLVAVATSDENLCRHYSGWNPFW